MKLDQQQRRREVWKRLVIDGEHQSTVEKEISEEYDVDPKTVRNDIKGMGDWLEELHNGGEESGVSQLRELRRNRRRLYELAESVDTIETELSIRQNIDRSIELDLAYTRHFPLDESETSVVQSEALPETPNTEVSRENENQSSGSGNRQHFSDYGSRNE